MCRRGAFRCCEALVLAARQVDEALTEINALHIPTVAVVKGASLGAGCELAVLWGATHRDAAFQFPSTPDSLFHSSVLAALSALPKKQEVYRLAESAESFIVQDAMGLGIVDQLLLTRRFLQDTEELLTMLVAAV